ncbi:MAG: RNA polymerase sigma factor SigY [Bacillota bacterium]
MASAEYDIVAEAKHGNKSALNTLLVESYPVVYGYIMKLTGNTDTANDVVQEAMLKAVINIKKYEPKAKFSTWLITVATNVYRDMLRKNKVQLQLDENLASHGNEVEEEALSNIQYEQIRDIVQQLAYEKRTVFILKHFYGYKYEEIADILNCPIGTVRSRLHNAVKYIISEFERRGILYG